MRRFQLGFLAALFAASPGLAQTVSGRVVEAGSGAPVAGALVSIRGADGAPLREVLSDATGGYVLSASGPGVYRVQVERIGHRTTLSPPLTLAAGEAATYRFEVPDERVMLDEIVVTGSSSRCQTAGESAASVLTLWEEARKSLRSSQLGAPPPGFSYQVRRRVRRLDASTEGVVSEQGDSVRSFLSGDPFVSVALERGFVEDRGDTLIFNAPDARVLLSDAFLAGHCFALRSGRDEQAGMLGLGFQPVRRDGADIRGVLWLDARTAELRYVDFTFQDLPRGLPEGPYGGRVAFRRLPSGNWIVPRWRIRMPTGGPGSLASAGGARVPGMRAWGSSALLLEESGEVLQLRTRRGEVVPLVSYASIAGVVWDSTRGGPLPGAIVSLVGTSYAATADSAGRYRLQGISEGSYSLTFAHPRLDTLGYAPDPVLVRVTPPEQLTRDLITPTLVAMLTADCAAGPGARRGVLAGRVTDAERRPVPGSQLFAVWEGGRSVAVADGRGAFRFCDLPAGTVIRLTARAATDSSSADVTLPAGGGMQRDFSLRGAPPAQSRPVRLSRLTGDVVDADNGRPVAGAVIRVTGTARTDTTDRRGGFEFAGLPEGSHSLSIEHPQYGTGISRVELREIPLDVQLRMPRRTVALSAITVTARRMTPQQRMGQRIGRVMQVMTRQEIQQRIGAARHVGDLLRRLNGVIVREINYVNSSMLKEICIEPIGAGGRGPPQQAALDPNDPAMRASRPSLQDRDRGTFTCESVAVYVDDIPVGRAGEFLRDFPMDEIESIEYVRAPDAAFRLGLAGGNGVILIYTRGNGPYREARN